MKIEYLEEFAALATALSYAKVARQFHLSTSVLSKHIVAVEREVGQRLFERSTTSVELTAAGRRLYEGIFPILEQYRSFMDDYCATPLSRRPLSVTLNVRTLPVVRAFAQAGKRVEAGMGTKVVFEASSASPYLALANDGVDAVVTYASSLLPQDCTVVPLLDDPFVAIVPLEHPLASQASISILRDLPHHRIIRLKGAYFEAGQDVIADALARFGVKAPATYSLASTFDDITLFSDFQDVLILPSAATSVLQMVTPETHAYLPFEEDVAFPLAVVFRPKMNSAALDALIDEVRSLLADGR